MVKKLMVSACLLGTPCRYDGGSKTVAALRDMEDKVEMIPFCPECAGGLPIPRPPAEIQKGSGEDVWEGQAQVMDCNGVDRTKAFCEGAQKSLALYQRHQPDWVITKANSPSCGLGRIYDGSFSGSLRSGNGVTTVLLLKAGARMMTEDEFVKAQNQIMDEQNF